MTEVASHNYFDNIAGLVYNNSEAYLLFGNGEKTA